MKTIEFYIRKNLKIYSIYQLIKSSKEKSTFFKKCQHLRLEISQHFLKGFGILEVHLLIKKKCNFSFKTSAQKNIYLQ